MTWSNYAREGVRVVKSPSESSRFECAVTRVDIGAATTQEVAEGLAGADGDVLIVRFDARRRDLATVLASTGRRVLPAGTLTYWERVVESVVEDEGGSSEVEVRPISELGSAGRSIVEAIVRDSFASYPNHYAVNPLFDPDRAAAGYVEWALSRINDADGHVLVLCRSGEPIGVATMTDLGTELEIELAGLVASAQGRGDYGTLLAGCLRTAVRTGKARVVISTQADNVRVQRAWIKAGFKPFAAVETVHLATLGNL